MPIPQVVGRSRKRADKPTDTKRGGLCSEATSSFYNDNIIAYIVSLNSVRTIADTLGINISTLGLQAKVRRKLHLLELVSQALELQCCTDAVHHLDGTGKHMECHGTLRLNLLTTD